MPLYQVILLAIVQGITEFLPISSSGHLALSPWVFGWEDQGLTYDIALHFGTLAAVLIYFFKDWMQLIAHGFGRLEFGSDPELRKNPRMMWMILAATVPVGVTGLVFADAAEHAWRNPFQIGGMLIGVALLMALAEKIGRRQKDLGSITLKDTMTIGLFQALAVVPGTSRSGITITAGLFRNIDRAAAARFSFLLSTPAIGAAALKAGYDLYKAGGIPPDLHVAFALGVVVSAITGCVAIAVLLRFLRRFSLKFFIYYRIVIGIIVIALAVFWPQAG